MCAVRAGAIRQAIISTIHGTPVRQTPVICCRGSGMRIRPKQHKKVSVDVGKDAEGFGREEPSSDLSSEVRPFALRDRTVLDENLMKEPRSFHRFRRTHDGLVQHAGLARRELEFSSDNYWF